MLKNTINTYIAGFWRRTFAFIIDLLIISFFSYCIFTIFQSWIYNHPILSTLLGYIFVVLYFGLLNSALNNGQTLGKFFLKLQVIELTSQDSQPLSLIKSIIRAAILLAPFCLFSLTQNTPHILSTILNVILMSTLAALIYLFICNRKNRRSLHDYITGSLVININSEPEPLQKIWPMHRYILSGLLIILAAVNIWISIATDQENKSIVQLNNPKIISTTEFHTFSQEDEQYPTFSVYVIRVTNPQLVDSELFAEEVVDQLKSNPKTLQILNSKTNSSILFLVASYQFGVLSQNHAALYEISYESDNHFNISMIQSNRNFKIGSF